ncbi:hypothetical protein [Rariglobus hedericola]|uniref:Glycosyl transferase n=1 Tax=Rariglobus hedericola TaxID=2597822 RepID=A0A556QPW5_9BACT|nr:hypothetical protein [Rariglobus hedericola]TSJ78686.1 hypothetical protein FPL22_05105 [Rariglobus hedericola]
MRSFCTVVTWSYLPYVRALRDSLRESGNSEPFHVLVTDATRAQLPAAEDGLICITLDELAPQPPRAMRYYFSAFELCNALKPFVVSHLLTAGFERVIYLDSDLLASGSFAPVWSLLDEAPLLLTPHQLTPPPIDLLYITEIDIVDQGLFNGGFTAWRRGPESARILEWMHSRFPVYGFCDRQHGMFVDQKMLPLVAEYFPTSVKILRDPCLNIAFWNAHERAVRPAGDGRWEIDGRPVVFFHLSGYRTSKPGIICTYMAASDNDALIARCPWLSGVLARYHAGVIRHESGHPGIRYPYSHYEGTRLTSDFRRLLFETGELDRRSFAYWRIRIREFLRPIKHFFTRNFAALLNRVRSR